MHVWTFFQEFMHSLTCFLDCDNKNISKLKTACYLNNSPISKYAVFFVLAMFFTNNVLR